VEARVPEADDLTTDVGRWYAERFGVVPRVTAFVSDLDAAVTELAVDGTGSTTLDLDDEDARGVRLRGPSGVAVDVVQLAPAGTQEERIGGFIASAADLDGPPTEELADRTEAILAEAWDAIDRLLDGVAHNKVLATMLLVGQRARSDVATDSPEHWQRSAASSLLSGFVGRGAGS
jgi:hypothetical protein